MLTEHGIVQRRTYTISSNCDPAISGCAAWDEWTIPDLTPEQADKLLQAIDDLIKSHGGEFTGNN